MPVTKESILSPDPLRIEPVEAAECGGTVYVRQLDGTEFLEWVAGGPDDETVIKKLVRLVVACLCDENRTPLLDAADADALGKRNADLLQRLIDKAKEVNGIGKKAHEANVKN